MNNHLTIRVEASPGILHGREEEKAFLRQKIELAIRRAVGIGVEIEFVKNP
jgi:hypothetical protein